MNTYYLTVTTLNLQIMCRSHLPRTHSRKRRGFVTQVPHGGDISRKSPARGGVFKNNDVVFDDFRKITGNLGKKIHKSTNNFIWKILGWGKGWRFSEHGALGWGFSKKLSPGEKN